jgi:hypothetical protein
MMNSHFAVVPKPITAATRAATRSMSQVATRSPTSLTVNLGLLARHVARARCRVAFAAPSPARRLDEPGAAHADKRKKSYRSMLSRQTRAVERRGLPQIAHAVDCRCRSHPVASRLDGRAGGSQPG